MSDANAVREATFIVRRGLADPNLISFEHLSQPGVFLRQYSDQVVAAKRENTYQFKNDATWFIRPAIAKVSFLSIDLQTNNVETEQLSDIIVYETKLSNPTNLPMIVNYLKTI